MNEQASRTPDDEEGRRERAERLFEEALKRTPDVRLAFIDGACAGEEPLRAELESLLRHSASAETFFEHLEHAVIPPEPSPGPVIGQYRILGSIGAGGMGAVYRARDTRLNRDVALKFLPLFSSSSLDLEQRLLNEARSAAALEHANVCTVHEIGESDDGRPFIAMAYYDGETLKERLQRGALPIELAIDIAVQVARGLGAAHAHGIVHRDVKPANIMLTPDGTVKLLDFGLAKIADTGLTGPGCTPGTISYMSPEQIRGDAMDARSDLWSLGVVLYEMLTGAHPFRGGNDRVVTQAILHDKPESIRKRAPLATPSLQRITERLLQKNPGSRFQSAGELLVGLSSATSDRVRSTRRAVLAVLLVTATLGATLWLSDRVSLPGTVSGRVRAASTTGEAPVNVPKTIAVLPFASVNPDPREEYFSDGLTEELISVLSRVRSLRVAARTSAFAFKGQNRDIREIGTALNVGTILEGSVRNMDRRVRVEARLINVEDGLHLWSETYERELTDIFAIQNELAVSIASALRAELTPDERAQLGRRPTTNGEAIEFYLKGRHFWNQRTPGSYERAVEYFQRAIAADSQYAAPWAGLAGVYSLQALSGAANARLARERTRAAALRALELDDSHAEAHAALGLYLHAFEWNAARAEAELQRAIELDPSYTPARHYYGNLLGALGRLDEAVQQKLRAVEVDPLAPPLSETLAFTLLRAGRHDEALRHVRNALELDSTYWRATAVLGLYYEETGRIDDAIRAYEQANELAGSRIHRTRADIARVMARVGRTREARGLIAELRKEATVSGVYEPAVATALLASGDTTGAYAWLESAYAQGHPHLSFISGDSRFSGFMGESRFMDLMRRVGVQH